MIGYSYDLQKLQISSRSLYFPFIVDGVNGSTWHTNFYGPWVGFDWNFSTACWSPPIQLNAGYEFHYGWSHRKFDTINNPAILNYQYSNRMRHMIGHVFRLQAFYPFLCNWVAGVKLQYTTWHNAASQNDTIPPPSNTGLAPGVVQKTENLRWFSFAATFNLGYLF